MLHIRINLLIDKHTKIENIKYDKVEGFLCKSFFPLCYLFGDVVIFFSSYNKNYTTTAPVRPRFELLLIILAIYFLQLC